MPRQPELSQAFSKITTKLNVLKQEIGSLPGLSTTDQTSLVAAINEVKAVADAAAGGGVSIDDAVTNLTQAWSSSKINSEITGAITTALEGEDLSDLAAAIAALQVTDTGLVSTASAQSFTGPQQDQGRANIDAASATGVGDTEHDFEAEIDALITF